MIVLLIALQTVSHEKELKPVAPFLGTWEGKGEHPQGAYEQAAVAEWGLGKTVIYQRNRAMMGGRMAFEDFRVYSFDKKLRVHQWSGGVRREYEIEAKEKTLVFRQTACEGAKDVWRYTYEMGEAVSYALEVDGKPYVKATLRQKLPDPGQLGANRYSEKAEKIEGMDALVIHPDGAGPFPAIVLSPGGGAETYQGYEGFGRWFASWGYVVAIVAFHDEKAEERAAKFSKVADWLEKDPKVDPKKLVAAGHSRGGYACVLAATSDRRFVACVAMAPSGPEKIEGKHRPAMALLSGDDGDERACKAIYDQVAKPRMQATVEGMNHFFQPQGKATYVVKYAVAFLEACVRGDARFRAYFQGEKGVVVVAEE